MTVSLMVIVSFTITVSFVSVVAKWHLWQTPQDDSRAATIIVRVGCFICQGLKMYIFSVIPS